ncbi:MAG: sigma-70 family RNA polymerase sigma factor [Candidatus Kapabacteria bacterium]|nr:sigma-70 family RNA polymerase sigma factor [Candidatus Kapabacteria bacterium]
MDNLQRRQQEFLELLKPIQRKLESFCLNMTRDREEARDLMQDTIVVLWQHLDTLRDRSAFRSYAYTVATNTFKRRYTRSKFFGLLTEEHHETLASRDHSPEQITDHSILHDALRELPHRSREALVLFEIADMSIAEIQKIQGGTISSIKVRLMRARRMLQHRLGVSPNTQEQQTIGVQ